MLAAFRKYLSAKVNPITLSLLVLASTCLGQSRRGDVIANVPFPFVVADRTLPPGRYVVTPIGETNLRIYTGKQSVIFQTHSVTGKSPEGSGKVVFHRYGGVYFLSDIWVAANSSGRQLFASQAERQLAHGTNMELAILRIGLE